MTVRSGVGACCGDGISRLLDAECCRCPVPTARPHRNYTSLQTKERTHNDSYLTKCNCNCYLDADFPRYPPVEYLSRLKDSDVDRPGNIVSVFFFRFPWHDDHMNLRDSRYLALKRCIPFAGVITVDSCLPSLPVSGHTGKDRVTHKQAELKGFALYDRSAFMINFRAL